MKSLVFHLVFFCEEQHSWFISHTQPSLKNHFVGIVMADTTYKQPQTNFSGPFDRAPWVRCTWTSVGDTWGHEFLLLSSSLTSTFVANWTLSLLPNGIVPSEAEFKPGGWQGLRAIPSWNMNSFNLKLNYVEVLLCSHLESSAEWLTHQLIQSVAHFCLAIWGNLYPQDPK